MTKPTSYPPFDCAQLVWLARMLQIRKANSFREIGESIKWKARILEVHLHLETKRPN